MKLAILYNGEFGERFVCNLAAPKLCAYFGACGIDSCDYCKDYNHSDRIVYIAEVPDSAASSYIENVGEYVNRFECDAVIAINVHPDILIELPDLADFELLIVPAESGRWCMPGLRKQLAEICIERGIEFAAPKPFCSLSGDGKIREFTDEFGIGMPEFRVEVEDDVIRDVEVLRSDPCGCAYYVAKRMRGYVIGDKREFFKEIHQHQCAYPCMASMERDPELGEAPFHLAGYIMVYRFSLAAGIDATDFVPEKFRDIVKG